MNKVDSVHHKITEQIVEYFKKNIEAGKWEVGEKIPSENQLTADLGVSRASIRQAVSQLTGIGVLESVHGKGTYLIDNQTDENQIEDYKITSEDCRDIEKVLEFRRILESKACYLATKHKTPELVNELWKLLNDMIESKDNIEKFIEADIQFHQEICRISQNPLIEKSMNQIFEENRKAQKIMRKIFGYNDGIYYHKLIWKAINAGSTEQAEEYMFEHLQKGIERLHKGN